MISEEGDEREEARWMLPAVLNAGGRAGVGGDWLKGRWADGVRGAPPER